MSRVGCAGILVADTFCGPMNALPVEGQLLAIDAMIARAGGCAANVAISLSKQGIESSVYGCVGADPPAQIVLQALKDAGVGTDDVRVCSDYPTSQTVILLVEGEDRRYIHVFGANAAFAADDLLLDHLKELDVFYVGGLYAMPALHTDELSGVLKFCRENGVITVLDVVLPHYHKGFEGLDDLLPHIDWFLPNDTEAAQITGTDDPLAQIKIMREHGAHQVIITQGERGAVAAVAGEIWRAGIFSMDTIDPSGSGDAFTAGVINGVVNGWEIQQTLSYAAVLGASCTCKIGTTDGVFTAEEAAAYLESHQLELTQLEDSVS